RAVFQVEQRQQQVFSADIVVAQPKCFAEGQLEGFARRPAERDQGGVFGSGRRQLYRGPDRFGIHLLQVQQHRRQRRRIAEQAEQQVVGGDLVVGGVVRRVLGGDHRAARPGGEASEALFGVQGGRLGTRDEPLLGGLFGDAHAVADVGPRRPRAASLVDEVADQVVGDFAQVFAGQDGVRQLG